MIVETSSESNLRRKVTVLAVFLFLFILHVIFLFTLQLDRREFIWRDKPDTPFFHIKLAGDEYSFGKIAYNISSKQFFSQDGENPTAARMPLFPLAVSLIFLFTTNAVYGIILNCFIAALIALASFKIARLFWPYKISLACMLVVGLMPASFETFVMFASEPTYTLMLISSLLYFCKLNKETTSKNAFWCGLFSGLTALSRAEGILIIPIYFCYLLFSFSLKSPRSLLNIFFFLICSFSVISPWLIRNYLSMNYLGLSTMSGEVFSGAHNKRIMDRHPGSWGGFLSYASLEELALVNSMNEVQANKYKWQRGINVIKDYSLPYMAYVELRKLFNTFRPIFNILERKIYYSLNIILVAPFFILYILFFVFFKIFLKKYLILLLPCIIPVIVTLIFWGTTRWRMSCEPIIFSLVTAHLLSRRWQSRSV